MSYQEKSSIVSIVSNLIVLAFYSIFISSRLSAGIITDANALKYIGTTILIVIGASIVLRIVNLIIFTIINAIITRKEDDPEIEDERDKLFKYKSERVSQFIAGLGFIGALISIVLGFSATIFLSVLFASFLIGDLVASIVKITMYRKGI